MNTREVTLHIPENNYHFFMELARNLPFVQKIEEKEEDIPNKGEIINSISEGFKLIKQHQQGTFKLQTAKELLDEL